MWGNALGMPEIKESPRGKDAEKLAKGEGIFSFLLEFPLRLKQRNMLLVRLNSKHPKQVLYFSVWSM